MGIRGGEVAIRVPFRTMNSNVVTLESSIDPLL